MVGVHRGHRVDEARGKHAVVGRALADLEVGITRPAVLVPRLVALPEKGDVLLVENLLQRVVEGDDLHEGVLLRLRDLVGGRGVDLVPVVDRRQYGLLVILLRRGAAAGNHAAERRLGEDEQHLVVAHERIGRSVVAQHVLVQIGAVGGVGLRGGVAADQPRPFVVLLDGVDAQTRVVDVVHHVDQMFGHAVRVRGEALQRHGAEVPDEGVDVGVEQRRVVGVRRHDGVERRVRDDLAELFAHARLRVAVLQPHQQPHVERVGELAPLGDVAGVHQVLVRVAQRPRGVVERIGPFEVGEKLGVDLLLGVEFGFEDVVASLKSLAEGDVAVDVRPVRDEQRAHRQGDGLRIDVFVLHGLLDHVVGVGRPAGEVVPCAAVVAVADHVAVDVLGVHLHGVLDQLVVEQPCAVDHAVGSREEDVFQ